MSQYPVSSHVYSHVDQYVEEFANSIPVKHVVIDNFLDDSYAQSLYHDLPIMDGMPKSRDYVFSNKRELSTLDTHSEISQKLHEVFMSQTFAKFVSQLVGHELFIDPEYVGGGFHAGGVGSFLDFHTDFNVHPKHENWLRALNVLLYLNPGWEQSWGGELLLTDSPSNPTTAVAPVFNRLVIMESTDQSFHGYRTINFPEGLSRRSIAAYGYAHVESGSVVRHTTNWAPEGAGPVKRILAKNWSALVLTKNRFFGSATLKNRR